MKLLKSLVFVVAAGLMITACGGGNTPSDVAKKWAEACKNLDVATAKKYVSSQYQAKYDEAIAAMETPAAKEQVALAKSFLKEVKIEVSDEKIDGDEAQVNVKFIMMGQEDSQVVTLIKEDGKWKVNNTPNLFGTTENSSTPADVAEKWMEACKNLDMEEAKQYVSNEFQAGYDAAIAAMETPEAQEQLELAKPFMKELKVDVLNEKIDGNEAQVTVKLSAMGQEESQVVPLIKEDGKWKINQALSNQ